MANGQQGSKDQRQSKMESKTYTEGRFIFREFESGDLAFIIKSGTVEIIKNVDEENVVLATLGQGQLFGELALIDNSERMASARAVGGSVEVYVISREQFSKQLAQTNPFIRGLLKMLTEQLRAASKQVGTGSSDQAEDDSDEQEEDASGEQEEDAPGEQEEDASGEQEEDR